MKPDRIQDVYQASVDSLVEATRAVVETLFDGRAADWSWGGDCGYPIRLVVTKQRKYLLEVDAWITSCVKECLLTEEAAEVEIYHLCTSEGKKLAEQWKRRPGTLDAGFWDYGLSRVPYGVTWRLTLTNLDEVSFKDDQVIQLK